MTVKSNTESSFLRAALNYRYIVPVCLLFIFVASLRLQWPELSHSDDWSDAGAIVAGENFARMGFSKSHGLPIFRPGCNDVPPSVRPDSPDWKVLSVFGTYTRLPPLCQWACGLVSYYSGKSSLIPFRLFVILLSASAVAGFYILVAILFNSPRLAALTSAFYVANPFFIANFDSIHEGPYMDAFRNISFLAIVFFVFLHGKGRVVSWIVAWFALLLEALTTYEYMPWLTLTIIGVAAYLFFTEEKKASLAVVLLGTAFAVGLLFHFGLVAAHYGSIQEALNDRLSNAAQRISGNANLLGTAGAFSWSAWWQLVALRFPSQVSVIGWGGLIAATTLGVAMCLSLRQEDKRCLLWAFALALFLVFGGFTWYVLMPAHCVDHAGLSFLQKFLLPGICLLLATPVEAAARLMETSAVKSYFRFPLVVAFPAFLVCAGLLNSELPITAEKQAQEQEFYKIKTALLSLRPKVDYEDFIACNLMRPTWMMMYYTHSRVIPISTVKEFDALPVKPKLFLFVPLNNPETAELGKVLESYYRITSSCDNRRLPFYILERK